MIIAAPPVPLEKGSDGVVRVLGSRVTLDTVVSAFSDGATAEEIVHQYPTLTLPSVYGVIDYYLHHVTEVRAYLGERQQIASRVRQENERRFDPQGIRDRLLSRRAT